MNNIARFAERLLAASEKDITKRWLAAQQKPDGEIPWTANGKMDPWDHVHSAMCLAAMGFRPAAKAAFRYCARTQEPTGGWAAERVAGIVTNGTQESNHAAYLATGLWHLHFTRPDVDFLAELWPTLDRAIDFVVSMQEPSGAISWARDPSGKVWRAPLLAGSASIHGSLVCAIRIADHLGHDRPGWRHALSRLAGVLQDDMEVFANTDLPERVGRYSMDWYYPILGGAVRGPAGRQRLLDPSWSGRFVEEGVGCRCVDDHPWYTVAETCELILALDVCDLTRRAREILSWLHAQRTEQGTYWTGMTHPDGIIYPEGEQTTWTAGAVLLANDAVRGESLTREFFLQLSGEDLKQVEPISERPSLSARSATKPRPTAAARAGTWEELSQV